MIWSERHRSREENKNNAGGHVIANTEYACITLVNWCARTILKWYEKVSFKKKIKTARLCTLPKYVIEVYSYVTESYKRDVQTVQQTLEIITNRNAIIVYIQRSWVFSLDDETLQTTQCRYITRVFVTVFKDSIYNSKKLQA
jgi:hypothetical protein